MKLVTFQVSGPAGAQRRLGDLLGTGTVSYGCSVALHRWPQVGQSVKFEVQGIGTLEHTIVKGERGVDYVRNGMDGLLRAPRELAAV
jgi:hypothetical protein